MITPDQLVRETLAAEAELITMPPDTRARVSGLARRYRARRVATMTGSVVAVAAFAAAIPVVVGAFGPADIGTPPAAASTAYESWAPRGDLGDDLALAAAATAAWDAASAGGAPHTAVQVLWADTFATATAVVLAGTDAEGTRRLAVLDVHGATMRLFRDVEAPRELTHLSFSLFNDDEQHSPESYRDTLVVITPPASGWSVEWSGGPDPALGAGTVATQDGIAVIDISQSGPEGSPTIRLLDGSTVVYEGPIGSQS